MSCKSRLFTFILLRRAVILRVIFVPGHPYQPVAAPGNPPRTVPLAALGKELLPEKNGWPQRQYLFVFSVPVLLCIYTHAACTWVYENDLITV